MATQIGVPENTTDYRGATTAPLPGVATAMQYKMRSNAVFGTVLQCVLYFTVCTSVAPQIVPFGQMHLSFTHFVRFPYNRP